MGTSMGAGPLKGELLGLTWMQQASRRKTAFGASAGGPAEDLTQNVPLSRVVSQKMNFWGHGNKGGLYFVCRLGEERANVLLLACCYQEGFRPRISNLQALRPAGVRSD